MQTSLFAALALLTVPLASQTFIETFSYPDGPVPRWTVRNGTWQIVSGRLVPTSGSTWAYINKNGRSAVDSVLDGEFFFVGTGVQFAGLNSRHPGTPGDTSTLMVKIQNNGGLNDFDRVFSYERPLALGTFYVDIPGGTVQAYCRMITLDNEFWIEVDADRNGSFELVLSRRPITNLTGAGEIGMNGFGTSQMDNFEFFDAVLVPQAGALPRIGTTYNLDLDTPTGNSLWVGGLSLGNAGIPILDRAIPLSLDPILDITFAQPGLGLSGLTGANGKAVLGIPIPSDPALVGVQLFVSALTIDPLQFLGIGHISNEQFFQIQA